MATECLATLPAPLSEFMARGWESKSVEDQLEERERAKREAALPLSTESPEHRQKRESLQLTRSHLLEQIQNARSDAHRNLLKQSLQAIEKELADL